MPSFARLFKSRDQSSKKNLKTVVNGNIAPPKPQWSDAWLRTRVDPEEVAELLSGCTRELKSRALDIPFLLLPFRPTSDPSAARTFVRNYFFPPADREVLRGEKLMRELRLIEPMVLASVMKWCWSRLPGGVVTWEAYELFRTGEKESQFARDAFKTLIPLSVDSEARKQIIFEFFDLIAAIAAHGKSNGLGGRKLSRYAGWWAFEHYDTGKGFDAGYKGWSSAADAASHLFFAYLRSLYPDPAKGAPGIIGLPISLQQLVQATEYPPQAPTLMFNETTKVVMIVDVVSPTPYALLRRVKNFEYRDDDNALQQFANQDDPVRALTDECRRVLKCISSANESTVSTTKASTGLKDATWSRFEDMGFGSTIEESDGDEDSVSMLGPMRHAGGLKSNPRSPNGDLGRPTTPSWADFLSSGFADENANRSHMLLPPDKVLPPIQTTARGQSSQSHRRNLETESTLEPGELASINKLDLDDSFWWVWISSLAGEEPTSRKAVFGRCALIETIIKGGKWMIMEEQVKGAAPEPAPGAYIAEKKGFFGFTTRKKRRERRKSGPKKDALPSHAEAETVGPTTRTNVSPDLQARIHAAATELQRRNQQQGHLGSPHRRGRQEEIQDKTQSVMTLQPMLMSEASQAMKWASQYDKNEIRAKYLGDNLAAKGSSTDLLAPPVTNGMSTNASSVSLVRPTKDQELPLPPPPPEKVPLPASPAIVPFRETPATKVPLPASPAGTPLKETAPTKLPLPASPAVTPLKVIPPARVPLPESPAGTPLRETPALKDPPLSRLPLPSPPQDDALVRTPSPTPPNDSPLPPQPPTPPKSEKMSQPFAPAPATQHPAMREPLSPPPAFTALPESPSPAASPAATPTLPSEPQSSIPKKPGLPSPQERAKLIKKRKPGIKGMFGGKAGKEPPMTPAASPIESGPAVAAARAALAGRDKTQLNGSPIHQVVTQVRQEPPSPAPVASRGPTTPPPEPAYQAPQAPPSNQASQHPPRTDSIPEKATVQHPDGAPKTRRDEEYENLSRVDTNEREQADREFSTFDQGPLVEQPAFVPSESPETPRVVSPLQEQQTSLPAHAATTQQVEPEGPMEKIESKDFTREISPVQDRWAQIRKNAAERAARQSEEQSRKGEVRNSVDSETSGEETIESRVARIKARVAELTGNIDAPRR